ncbi:MULTISPECIES: Lrp/AsnC family transcriptional regulator [unclassified Lentimicrobium]|uniref:Lrp/AsnC family transcriptional regulator n=1 Tax=unclassified Lentimicrobium TaxID=2677434 RepID=UPI001C12F532|nr:MULTISPECIES: Lrp/AsnC ligand binding domain-containing protein [unclassified Lentimicrobium]
MSKIKFQIDSMDKQILDILMENARTPITLIARKLKISGAAIHQRLKKLKDAGVITGSKFALSPQGLGYHSLAFVGIQVNLTSGQTHHQVFDMILNIPEVVECHSITGKYSYMLKIYAHSNEHLKKILVEKIQSIIEVTSTETFLSLEEGFNRGLPIEIQS